jgi:hypothetical protein
MAIPAAFLIAQRITNHLQQMVLTMNVSCDLSARIRKGPDLGSKYVPSSELEESRLSRKPITNKPFV